MVHLETPWRWQDFGSGPMLVTDGGGAKVVICGSRTGQLVTRDEATGRLVPLASDSPLARFILRACNMLGAGILLGLRDDADMRRRGMLPPDRAHGLTENEQAAALMMNALLEQNQKLRSALDQAVEVAGEAADEWDAAPDGMKAGKLLVALAGRLKGYRPDIDQIHAVAKGDRE
jgi:hypothetical protein